MGRGNGVDEELERSANGVLVIDEGGEGSLGADQAEHEVVVGERGSSRANQPADRLDRGGRALACLDGAHRARREAERTAEAD